jgi:hypothetical protein
MIRACLSRPCATSTLPLEARMENKFDVASPPGLRGSRQRCERKHWKGRPCLPSRVGRCATSAVILGSLDRVQEGVQSPGDGSQQPGAFVRAGELIGPYLAGSTDGRFFDDRRVTLVRRDAQELVKSSRPLPAMARTRRGGRHGALLQGEDGRGNDRGNGPQIGLDGPSSRSSARVIETRDQCMTGEIEASQPVVARPERSRRRRARTVARTGPRPVPCRAGVLGCAAHSHPSGGDTLAYLFLQLLRGSHVILEPRPGVTTGVVSPIQRRAWLFSPIPGVWESARKRVLPQVW